MEPQTFLRCLAAVCCLVVSTALTAQTEGVDSAPPWHRLAFPSEEQFVAWVELRQADTDGPAEMWEVLRPVVEVNEACLSEVIASLDGFSQPPTLVPETGFPDHGGLRYAMELLVLRSRLQLRDGDREASLRSLADAGRLGDKMMGVADGIIPLIQFSGAFGVWLDGVYWQLLQAERLAGDEKRAVRAELIGELRARQNLVRAAVLRSFDGEARLFARVARRLPEPWYPMETYLDALSHLGLPDAELHVPVVSRFGFPNPRWLDREATARLVRDELGPWASMLAAEDQLPPVGSFTERYFARVEAFREAVGPMLPLLEGAYDETMPIPLMPYWLYRFNQTYNPLGEFLFSMLTSPFERIAESAYMREAKRRILIVLASGEADSDLVPGHSELTDLERTDPYTGAPLRIDTGTCAVWSVGRDRTDNEGSENDIIFELRGVVRRARSGDM